jgi:hypothetical protein
VTHQGVMDENLEKRDPQTDLAQSKRDLQTQISILATHQEFVDEVVESFIAGAMRERASLCKSESEEIEESQFQRERDFARYMNPPPPLSRSRESEFARLVGQGEREGGSGGHVPGVGGVKEEQSHGGGEEGVCAWGRVAVGKEEEEEEEEEEEGREGLTRHWGGGNMRAELQGLASTRSLPLSLPPPPSPSVRVCGLHARPSELGILHTHRRIHARTHAHTHTYTHTHTHTHIHTHTNTHTHTHRNTMLVLR